MRYRRLGLACSAVMVTAVSVLGGLGAMPLAADEGSPAVNQDAVSLSGSRIAPTPAGADAPTPLPEAAPAETDPPVGDVLPADSGAGRRVVFSEERQRVWLVDADDQVRRSYLVSGSIYDNLALGTFEVYSRSGHAWGIDDSGSMRWFVRFTRGDTGAAIGFHDIPVDEGAQVQTVDQLGTPLSHGCIRQRAADARALWRFAPLGTTVVVTT